MTHIFVVNERTFKIHLEYMFAGTGYSTHIPDFIETEKTITTADFDEKTFVSMIADISKIRENDLVAFYVTGCKKIFGFFQAISVPFYNSASEDYLGKELGRYLPFRVRLKPFMVFSEGITEHKALDDIYNIEHPYQMCWSLIYRKLTGMRGCSFITDFEYLNLNLLISIANKNKPLYAEHYTYDSQQQKIVKSDKAYCYVGDTRIGLDVKRRLLRVTNSHEAHLQAYITQNHDKSPLKELLYPDKFRSIWIGNEVVCSVGEQRIDILSIVETKEKYYIRITELKDETPSKDIVEKQIQWYIHWVAQYLIPLMNDKEVVVIPTIIAKKHKRNTNKKIKFVSACDFFKKTKISKLYNITINPVEYIAFERITDDITFEKVF